MPHEPNETDERRIRKAAQLRAETHVGRRMRPDEIDWDFDEAVVKAEDQAEGGFFSPAKGSRPVVEADLTKSLASSVSKALGGEKVPTPHEAMGIEHGRLLKAFRESEGREPTLADSEYWVAWNSIFRNRTGAAS